MTASVPDGIWTTHLAAAPVRAVLERAQVLVALHGVAEVGSTQDLARELAAAGAPGGTVVVADRQLAGRGRSGRTWDDRPDGGTLALTALLDVGEQVPRADAPELGLVPHALGLAVLRACGRALPQPEGLALKWPNDVVHRTGPDASGRKLSGVLVEREHMDAPAGRRDVLLCGIGVDVDLVAGGGAPDRVCLTELSGATPDRRGLLIALLDALDDALGLLRAMPREVLESYRRRSDTIGRAIQVERPSSQALAGIATDVDDHGRLLVSSGGEIHAILAGTVRDAEPDGGRSTIRGGQVR